MLSEDETRLSEAAILICEINMGATAIGTGITSHPAYAALVREKLADIAGVPVVTAIDLIEATQDCGAFVQLSGVLKTGGCQALEDLQRSAPAVLWPARRL